MSIDTRLFGFVAERIGDVSSELFAKLIAAETKVTVTGGFLSRKCEGTPMEDDTVKLFQDWKLPEKIDPKTAWVRKADNYCNVLVVTFSDKSTNGLLIIEEEGVWSVCGGEYPWREASYHI
jgi:hypothetical protein